MVASLESSEACVEEAFLSRSKSAKALLRFASVSKSGDAALRLKVLPGAKERRPGKATLLGERDLALAPGRTCHLGVGAIQEELLGRPAER